MSNFLMKNGDKASWEIPEGYPYKEQGWVSSGIQNQVFRFREEGDKFQSSFSGANFVVGDTYKITWDGTDYICTAVEIQGAVCIGNATVVGGSGNDEPFLMIAAGNLTTIVALVDGVEHTISLSLLSEITHPMAPEFLPDGYPYKENSKIVIEWDGNIDDKLAVGDMYYKVSDAILGYKTIKNSIVYIQHSYGIEKVAMEKFWNTAYITDEIVVAFQGIIFVKVDNVEYGGLTYPEAGIYFLKTGSDCVIKFSSSIETIHPMAAEFLPTATPTATGTVKQAAAVADVTAAPTAEEFNALLKSLRDAGILATE